MHIHGDALRLLNLPLWKLSPRTAPAAAASAAGRGEAARTAPHRTVPHRTAPHRTAPHRSGVASRLLVVQYVAALANVVDAGRLGRLAPRPPPGEALSFQACVKTASASGRASWSWSCFHSRMQASWSSTELPEKKGLLHQAHCPRSTTALLSSADQPLLIAACLVATRKVRVAVRRFPAARRHCSLSLACLCLWWREGGAARGNTVGVRRACAGAGAAASVTPRGSRAVAARSSSSRRWRRCVAWCRRGC